MANELEAIYGPHCSAGQIEVRAFGHSFGFLKAGANALLRAVIDASDTGYDVYSIWAYNCRPVTGGAGWSAHAWAAAVDINPDKNPYSSSARLITNMPTAFVQAFTRQGFGWGGNWHSIKDPMHFSLAPSEQGSGGKESFDPSLQERANAAWGGASPAAPPKPIRPGTPAPPWEHEHPGYIERPHPQCQATLRWQRQMAERGWTIDDDGIYGVDAETVCQAFQREKGLTVDGVLGPNTWKAAWEAPVT